MIQSPWYKVNRYSSKIGDCYLEIWSKCYKTFLASPWYACKFYLILCIVEKSSPYLSSCLFLVRQLSCPQEQILELWCAWIVVMEVLGLPWISFSNIWNFWIKMWKYHNMTNSHLKVSYDVKVRWIGSNKYTLNLS
jgi:hypothetical protein